MSQVLPEYLSEWTTHRVSMEGVVCTPHTEIKDYEIKDGQLNLILTSGKSVSFICTNNFFNSTQKSTQSVNSS